MTHKVVYPVIFLLASFSSVIAILFLEFPGVNWLVPGYGILVFGFALVRHLYVLIKLSKLAKEVTPNLYDEHVGYSKWGSVGMLSPSYAFSKISDLPDNRNLLRLVSELKHLYIFLFGSFLVNVALGLLTVL